MFQISIILLIRFLIPPQYYTTTSNETDKQITDRSKDNTFDLDSIILENDTSSESDSKLQNSRWL